MGFHPILEMRTKKFQCATWLSIAHQCAHMRTLLDTLLKRLFFMAQKSVRNCYWIFFLKDYDKNYFNQVSILLPRRYPDLKWPTRIKGLHPSYSLWKTLKPVNINTSDLYARFDAQLRFSDGSQHNLSDGPLAYKFFKIAIIINYLINFNDGNYFCVLYHHVLPIITYVESLGRLF